MTFQSGEQSFFSFSEGHPFVLHIILFRVDSPHGLRAPTPSVSLTHAHLVHFGFSLRNIGHTLSSSVPPPPPCHFLPIPLSSLPAC